MPPGRPARQRHYHPTRWGSNFFVFQGRLRFEIDGRENGCRSNTLASRFCLARSIPVRNDGPPTLQSFSLCRNHQATIEILSPLSAGH